MVVWIPTCSQFFFRWAWYTRYYTVVQRIICLACINIYKSAAAADAAALYRCSRCSSFWCSPSCTGWQKLLLVHSIWFHPRFSCSVFKHDIFLMYIPLGSAVASTASVRLYYILDSYGHARSQGGHQWCAVFFTYEYFVCLESCRFTAEYLYCRTWYTRYYTVVRRN